MKMPPLLADFTHARPCKPFCEKYLTLPIKVVSTVLLTTEIAIIGSFRYSMGEMSGKEIFAFSAIHLSIYALSYIMLCALFKHYYLYWDLLLPEILNIMVWEMSSGKRKRGFLK